MGSLKRRSFFYVFYVIFKRVLCGAGKIQPMKHSFLFLLLLSLPFVTCSAQTADSAAIKLVLEKESATWRSGDAAAHASCWYIRPYSRILISTPEGATYDVPPANMVNLSLPMGHGGSSKNTNYKLSINGNSAWVNHNELSLSTTGDKTYTYEFKMLEKIKDEWKIVGESIHVYKPK